VTYEGYVLTHNRVSRISRRDFVGAAAGTAMSAVAIASLGAPFVVRAQTPLALRFRTIPDPDGWHPSLRLKGDWLVFEIGDGRLAGFGEASHSTDDEACKRAAVELFDRHYRNFSLSLENLARRERELAESNPDLVTATALSGLNQAFYDLLAKREQVPVWRLFANQTGLESIALYTTINRALQTRTREEYLAIAGELAAQGFVSFKCAPFEAVDGPDNAVRKSAAGIAMLDTLRERFPDLGIRVDFHERFALRDFFELVPEFERLRLEWLEEPFAMGPVYEELRTRTALRIAGGELFWGKQRFEEIADNEWVDVIMPDVKHVGGFGPLLGVLEMAAGRIEVSPHNPSGPISTAASLHAVAIYPEIARSLEYSFDRKQARRSTGETIENGRLYLNDKPGWGVEPV
jgi:galactonate dehydratase